MFNLFKLFMENHKFFVRKFGNIFQVYFLYYEYLTFHEIRYSTKLIENLRSYNREFPSKIQTHLRKSSQWNTNKYSIENPDTSLKNNDITVQINNLY